MNLSILHRLLLVAILALGSFAVLIPLAQTAIFSSTLEENERRRLEADARTVFAAIQVIDNQLVMPDAMDNQNFNRIESDLVGAVFDDLGTVLWRSSSARDFLPDYHPVYETDEIVFTSLGATAGAAAYFIYDWDVEIDGKRYSIVTGDRTSNYDATLASLKRQSRLWLSIAFVGLVVLLAAGLVWALRPLRRMYRQLINVERGKKTQLEGEYPAELSRLARALNSLLAAERLRREQYETKVSDLAHGLKTPLAVISQACRKLPAPDANIIDDHVQMMNQLVNFHLQKALPIRPAWVSAHLDLSPVLEKVCISLDKVYHDKGIVWDIEIADSSVLVTEEEALEIFGNLLDNAFRLCLGRVRIRVLQDADKEKVLVEDDGPGVPEPIRESILKRGIRADTLHPGQGIGLSLVVDMLNEIQGKLIIDDSALGGACFTVELPRVSRSA